MAVCALVMQGAAALGSEEMKLLLIGLHQSLFISFVIFLTSWHIYLIREFVLKGTLKYFLKTASG